MCVLQCPSDSRANNQHSSDAEMDSSPALYEGVMVSTRDVDGVTATAGASARRVQGVQKRKLAPEVDTSDATAAATSSSGACSIHGVVSAWRVFPRNEAETRVSAEQGSTSNVQVGAAMNQGATAGEGDGSGSSITTSNTGRQRSASFEHYVLDKRSQAEAMLSSVSGSVMC